MATIFWSMAGEGRGHATRMRTLVEQLRHEHKIVLFAPADAFKFLSPLYANSDLNVEVEEIPGLLFKYENKKLHLIKSILSGGRFLQKTLPSLQERLRKRIENEKPDLILTDFEPALPRAATQCGIPFVSLSHQHFLVSYDLSSLPKRLRFHAWMMSWAVKAYYSGQKKTLVSAFFEGTLKKRYKKVIPLGPMINEDIRNAEITKGGYLLSYMRSITEMSAIEELEKSKQRIKLYGMGERPPMGNISFHPISPESFVNDLAGCGGVICAAGNQLLGECLYLGKPVLAVPEKVHHEQMINSHFLKQMGCGDFVPIEELRLSHIENFLEKRETYEKSLEKTCQKLDGTQHAAKLLRSYLNGKWLDGK